VKKKFYNFSFLNPLSASVEYTAHDGDVTWLYHLVQAKSLKTALVFLKEEKIC